MVNQDNRLVLKTYVGLSALQSVKGTGQHLTGLDGSGNPNTIISHDRDGKIGVTWWAAPYLPSAYADEIKKTACFPCPAVLTKNGGCNGLYPNPNCYGTLFASIHISNFNATAASLTNTGVVIGGDAIGEMIVS
jgi:hypothetical protein